MQIQITIPFRVFGPYKTLLSLSPYQCLYVPWLNLANAKKKKLYLLCLQLAVFPGHSWVIKPTPNSPFLWDRGIPSDTIFLESKLVCVAKASQSVQPFWHNTPCRHKLCSLCLESTVPTGVLPQPYVVGLHYHACCVLKYIYASMADSAVRGPGGRTITRMGQRA